MKRIVIAAAFTSLMLCAVTVCAQSQSREDLFNKIDATRAELSKLETAFLSPSKDDRAAYEEFLRQPDTGLIRLLPREKYDPVAIRDKTTNTKTLSVNGGGSYYSFARLSHDYGGGCDVGLYDGWLSTGFAGANYGIMRNLEDTPLENVVLESSDIRVLSMHTPAPDEPKARIEQRKWGQGETIDGITYGERLRLAVNTTYAVRSIAYFGTDVLVAFRVVRLDTDGSAIILWKLLKKYPIPTLARNN